MLDFYKDCSQEFSSSTSWVTPAAQTVSALAASLAFWIGIKNLRGITRTQALQAEVTLINFENQIRKLHGEFTIAERKYAVATESKDEKIREEIPSLAVTKQSSLDIFVSSAERLASLINSENISKQLVGRTWEEEYKDLFTNVQSYWETEMEGSGNKKIPNILSKLEEWGKKANK